MGSQHPPNRISQGPRRAPLVCAANPRARLVSCGPGPPDRLASLPVPRSGHDQPRAHPPAPQSDLAQSLLRGLYALELLGVAQPTFERTLERTPTDRLRDLFRELGRGFAFAGSQHRIEVGGEACYIERVSSGHVSCRRCARSLPPTDGAGAAHGERRRRPLQRTAPRDSRSRNAIRRSVTSFSAPAARATGPRHPDGQSTARSARSDPRRHGRSSSPRADRRSSIHRPACERHAR